MVTCCGVASSAQLTYQLGNTTLLIDEVVDSSRVNIPWEILWGPDDRLWMTDGPLITRWDPVTDVIDTLLDRGHGNGLGMALHPDFPMVPEVFAVFDTAEYYGWGQLCELLRFTYDAVNDTLQEAALMLTYPHSGEHGGGRLLFDTTGQLLVTTADYWHPSDTLFYNRGKTLRIAPDGSVPPDNPRADYTWSWGHRNPQGLALLPNGAVVNSEHGQGTNEINLILPNRDHGWFAYDGAMCTNIFPDSCTSPTFVNTLPLVQFFQPPSGCEFYTSDLVPELQDKLITCILWQTGLVLFTFNAALDSITEHEHISGGAFADMVRNRDIAIRPDGSFYLITNDRQDARIRWVRADDATASSESTVALDALRAWPNPMTDRLTVSVLDAAADAQVELLDALGRRAGPVPSRIGDRFVFDVGALPSGAYAVRLGDDRCERVIKR
jgi:glucose/arabinose dehydrogenase